MLHLRRVAQKHALRALMLTLPVLTLPKPQWAKYLEQQLAKPHGRLLRAAKFKVALKWLSLVRVSLAALSRKLPSKPIETLTSRKLLA